MERALITGAGGFLGGHLIAESPLKTDLFGLTRRSTVNLKGDQWFRASVADQDHLLHTLDRIRPNIILHTAAVSGELDCKADIDYARKVNVDSCRLLAEWCAANDCYLLFTSTDLVFDGLHAPYSESDATGSKMVYGQLKSEAEQVLLGNPDTLIVRLPLLYGIGLGDRKGMMHQLMQKSLEGESQGCFTDEFRTPSCVSDVAAYIWKLVERKETGILHLGGRERMSRMEMAVQFAKHFQLHAEGLKPIKRKDINMEYRPEDTSLDSHKAYSLGFDPRPMHVCLKEMAGVMSRPSE